MRKNITIRNKTISIWLVATLILGIILSIVAAAYVYELTIPGTVIVEPTPEANYEFEAFEDFACTIPLTHIDWGTMRAGEFKRITIYLKNTGNGTIIEINYTTKIWGDSGVSGNRNVDFRPGTVISLEVGISVSNECLGGTFTVSTTLKAVA